MKKCKKPEQKPLFTLVPVLIDGYSFWNMGYKFELRCNGVELISKECYVDHSSAMEAGREAFWKIREAT